MKTYGIQLIAEFNGCPPNLLNDESQLEDILAAGMKCCGLRQVRIDSHKFEPIGVTVISIINESHIAIHTYPEAHHASVDIFHCSSNSTPIIELLSFLKAKFRAQSVKFMELSRGSKLELTETNCITSAANYGFEVRYHFTKMLFTKISKYHKIEVVENENFGRMMFLDGDLQLAEKDVHIYNQAMVAPLVSKSKFRNVAILGGGDGGVLNEVLKHGPGSATLVDIDEDVITVSKKYLSTVCGQAFEQPNSRVVVGDARHFLDANFGFDAIIYDLTMDPELLTNKDKRGFLNEMLAKVQQSLNSDGVLSMQCCSKHDTRTFRLIQDTLSHYFTMLRFKTVFIPSFCEPWIFGSAMCK